jgi:hypothetical protein
VVNDRVGDPDIVLVGNAATHTVRAADQDWRVEEDALRAPDGQRLEKWPRRDAAGPSFRNCPTRGAWDGGRRARIRCGRLRHRDPDNAILVPIPAVEIRPR